MELEYQSHCGSPVQNADTDFDGNFNINASVGDVLKVSMLGFEAVSVKATVNPMNITTKNLRIQH
jgi:hypothetical protein